MINFGTLNMPTMRFMVGPTPSVNIGLLNRMPRIGVFNNMLGHANPIFTGFTVPPVSSFNFPPLFHGTGVFLNTPAPTASLFGHPNMLGLFG